MPTIAKFKLPISYVMNQAQRDYQLQLAQIEEFLWIAKSQNSYNKVSISVDIKINPEKSHRMDEEHLAIRYELQTRKGPYSIAKFDICFYKNLCERMSMIMSAPTVHGTSIDIGTRGHKYTDYSAKMTKKNIDPTTGVLEFLALQESMSHDKFQSYAKRNKNLKRLVDKVTSWHFGDNLQKLKGRIDAQRTIEHFDWLENPAIVDYFVPRTDLEIALEHLQD